MPEDRSTGFWVLAGLGTLLLVMLLAAQTTALIDYDLAVSWGLQEAPSAITEMGVAVNKGSAAADTFIYVPLLAIGLAGYWLKKRWGTIALAAALGITTYWPIVALWTLYAARGVPGFNFSSHASYTVMLVPFVVYALWGLIFLCSHRRETA